MEMDVFIRHFALALEYQGKQHYEEISTLPFGVGKDKVKQMGCSNIGISLIEVPYWWDEKEESLLDLITQNRADITVEISGGESSATPKIPA